MYFGRAMAMASDVRDSEAASTEMSSLNSTISVELENLSLEFGLLITVSGGLCDLRIEILNKHVIGMLGIHFLLLQTGSLLNESIKELLEQLNNTTRLELVCIGFWGAPAAGRRQ